MNRRNKRKEVKTERQNETYKHAKGEREKRGREKPAVRRRGQHVHLLDREGSHLYCQQDLTSAPTVTEGGEKIKYIPITFIFHSHLECVCAVVLPAGGKLSVVAALQQLQQVQRVSATTGATGCSRCKVSTGDGDVPLVCVFAPKRNGQEK